MSLENRQEKQLVKWRVEEWLGMQCEILMVTEDEQRARYLTEIGTQCGSFWHHTRSMRVYRRRMWKVVIGWSEKCPMGQIKEQQ